MWCAVVGWGGVGLARVRYGRLRSDMLEYGTVG